VSTNETIFTKIQSKIRGLDNPSELEMKLYEKITEEYDAGNYHKGFYAKIAAENNYDENLIKAEYIKKRVANALNDKKKIIELTKSLLLNSSQAIQLENEIKKLESDNEKYNSLTEEEIISRVNKKKAQLATANDQKKDLAYGYTVSVSFSIMITSVYFFRNLLSSSALAVYVAVAIILTSVLCYFSLRLVIYPKVEKKYSTEINNVDKLRAEVIKEHEESREDNIAHIEKKLRQSSNLIATLKSQIISTEESLNEYFR
jgi:hypothetical protein